MKIRAKRLHDKAIMPCYAKYGDAGMDLYATDVDYDKYGNLVCHTGLAMEIPEGHVGLLFPRSSIAKTPLSLCNSVGVIDSGYRGEIVLKFNREDRYTAEGTVYIAGNRVGQIIIMPYPKVGFVEAEHLSKSERGEGAFGSTDSVEEFIIKHSNGEANE